MQTPKGLSGVIVDETKISYLDVEQALIFYRGFNLRDLVQSDFDFESIAYLILKGELPENVEAVRQLWQPERESRDLPSAWASLLCESDFLDLPPMKLLSAALSTHKASDFSPTEAEEKYFLKVFNLWGFIPTLLASSYRKRNSLPASSADQTLRQTENLFKMFFDHVPSNSLIQLFDQTRIIYAEHEFNAATFAARVVTSTQADFGAAIVTAINALKGPIHGGAIEEIMKMLLEIENHNDIERWVDQKILENEKIPGFGHRLYRDQPDPRFSMMLTCLEAASKELDNYHWLDIVNRLNEIVSTKKNVFPNLDLASAPLYYLLNFPVEFHTSLIALSRYVGWCAHIREQALNNRIIRPSAKFTGNISKL